MQERPVGVEAFEFIDRLGDIQTVDSMVEAFVKQVSRFGFTDFLITGLPPPRQRLDDHIILSGWSEEWFRHYMENEYYSQDPMAKHTRTTTEPFMWSETGWEKTAGNEAKQVMCEATEFGLADGFSVPILGLDGDQFCVTMGGRDIDLSPHGRGAIHLMSFYLHHRASALRPARKPSRRTQLGGKQLSKREIECLRWVANGKTDWEIGQILSISSATVTVHVKAATKKLKSVNRTQAVAVALVNHAIHL